MYSPFLVQSQTVFMLTVQNVESGLSA